MGKDGLLHRVKRAVIFQVLKQRLPFAEAVELLGTSEGTLRGFLDREGFLSADDVDGPYKEDLKALRSITGIELENGSHQVGVTRKIAEMNARISELLDVQVKYNQLLMTHRRLKATLENERRDSRLLRVINGTLRKALGKTRSEEVIALAVKGDDEAHYLPSPEVIEAECVKIRRERDGRPSCEGEVEVRPDKVYRLKFKGDRRLP